MPNRFVIGESTVATPAAMKACAKEGLTANDLVARHHAGDWGTADAEANEAGLDGSDMLISIFDVGGASVWVVTEQDRSATTVCLPTER